MGNKEGLINKKSERMIKVTFNNYEVREFREGTTLKEISEFVKDNYSYDILVAKVDNDICDYVIHVPSQITPRIQEAHIFIGHTIAEYVAHELFGNTESDSEI